MKRLATVVLALLVIPLVAWAIGSAIDATFNDQLQQGFTKRYGAGKAAQIMQTTSVHSLCVTPGRSKDLDTVCQADTAASLMRTGAVWSGAVGLALIAGIGLSGYLARRNRNLLAIIFGKGLYVTMVLGVALLLANAALTIATLYYGGGVLMGVVFDRLMFIIGGAALFGAWWMIRGMLSALKRAAANVFGQQLSREEHPELWNLVTSLAARLGAAAPDTIVGGLDTNFYVTEAEVQSLDGKAAGRTLYVSLPLCRILSKGELTAIIGHELGHFRGEDTKFSHRFYPVYRGSIHALQALAGSMRGLGATVALWPAYMLLRYFLASFAEAEGHVSRERELVADQVAVEAAGVRATASALVKVHAFADLWGAVEKEMQEQLRAGGALANASLGFAGLVQERRSPEAINQVDRRRVPHPTDSHPPLGTRLQALGLTVPEVADAALATEPDLPAISVVQGAEELEQQLTGRLNAIIARNIGLRPGSA